MLVTPGSERVKTGFTSIKAILTIITTNLSRIF